MNVAQVVADHLVDIINVFHDEPPLIDFFLLPGFIIIRLFFTQPIKYADHQKGYAMTR